MGTLREVLEHPEDLMALVRIKVEAARMKRQIPPQPHWAFCYSMLDKISRTFAFVIQLLPPDLRNAVCIFYLVLRALDTIEDDPNISSDKKVPVLQSYYQHIRDSDLPLSCGWKDFKILMDKFHFVSMAFLELEKSYQGIIEDIAKRMGAGMSKFLCKEVETVEDYDEYCHIVAGLVGLGLSRLFDAAGLEVLVPESLSNSMGLFVQKASVIRDYSEDINEVPNPRILWPRQIWSKYTDKLEDFKYEENSKKAVECLNDMVTNALMHVEDCLQYMSTLQDPAIFQFCAIPQIMAIGLLAFYYNNVEVFRRVVNMRHGLAAQIVARTRNMSDVYDAFFEFSGMLKSKVDKNDPNAIRTLSQVEAIQKACIKSGLLSKRGYYLGVGKQRFNPMLITIVFLLLSVFVVIISKQ